jgi:hypothetical protein
MTPREIAAVADLVDPLMAALEADPATLAPRLTELADAARRVTIEHETLIPFTTALAGYCRRLQGETR